jgi:hypothetical protein
MTIDTLWLVHSHVSGRAAISADMPTGDCKIFCHAKGKIMIFHGAAHA